MIEVANQMTKYLKSNATTHGWYNPKYGRKYNFKLKYIPELIYLPLSKDEVAQIKISATCTVLASDIANIIFVFYNNSNIPKQTINELLPTQDNGLLLKLNNTN